MTLSRKRNIVVVVVFTDDETGHDISLNKSLYTKSLVCCYDERRVIYFMTIILQFIKTPYMDCQHICTTMLDVFLAQQLACYTCITYRGGWPRVCKKCVWQVCVSVLYHNSRLSGKVFSNIYTLSNKHRISDHSSKYDYTSHNCPRLWERATPPGASQSLAPSGSPSNSGLEENLRNPRSDKTNTSPVC